MKAEVSDCSPTGELGPPSLQPPPTQGNTSKRPSLTSLRSYTVWYEIHVREWWFPRGFTDYQVGLVMGREDGRFCQPVEQVWETLGEPSFMVLSSGISDSLKYAMSLRICGVGGGILCNIPKLYWTADTLGGKDMLGLATKGTLGSCVFLQKLFILLEFISVLWADFH